MVLPDGEMDGWGYSGGIKNIKRVMRKIGLCSMKKVSGGALEAVSHSHKFHCGVPVWRRRQPVGFIVKYND